MSAKQPRYRYRIIDSSKGKVLRNGHGGLEDLKNLFPAEIHGFLREEIDKGRLVDIRLKMTDFTNEMVKIV